ncbi:MAG TPA: protein kinase [Thermoanaerobaculia bacterium]|nr:protein kinase [Thermoanaerobaculia bacterium]
MSDIPQSFDRFEIVRILGKGGMGTVYLAKDRRLARSVALKVLHRSDLDDDERRARFMREARTAASVRHQNVATIYEVSETDDGQPFLVMEYCEGETLSQRMRRRPLDAGEFLQYARQIVAGLAAAHENGVIHRDIKTANIIIESTGLVKILDFGLAKILPTDRQATVESTTGRFFGTLHYVSPEQARGDNVDERSDLFSTGVVLYQMASGHLPFNAESPLLVAEKIREAEPEPFVPIDAAFPAAAAKIIGRLLQKNPADRYQSARDLLRDLEAIDTPTLRMTTPMTNTRSMLGRTVRRPKWLRIAITLFALAIVAGTIWFVHIHGNNVVSTDAATGTQQPIHSLAVLPLQNIASNTRDDFLSVGLADALTTKLQQVPSLNVRPTSAVIAFRGQKIDAKTAGEKLGVDGVLEGRFLAAGDLVRVNLQLTDARTGYSVWADSVDGKRDDLLKLIDDVSTRTVTALNQKLGVQQTAEPHSVPRSSNPRAYEEYLKARSLAGSFVPKEFAEHIALLKRAIELDPNFAAAYADLGIALSFAQARGLTNEPPEKAEWYARQAVRLDPNLAESHLALGRVFVRIPERFRESVREALAGLRLKPNDTVGLHSMTTYFVSNGELLKAQCVGDRLVRVDPESNEAKTRGYWFVNSIDPEGALKSAPAALESKDTELAGHDIRGSAYLLLGNVDAADQEANEALKVSPRHYLGKSLKAMIAAAQGNRIACETHIASFEVDANRVHWAALRVALCYAKLGDRDKAIFWLHRAADLGNHSWYALVKHPWLEALQADPEFQEIVGKIKADLDDVADDVVGVYQLICK